MSDYGDAVATEEEARLEVIEAAWHDPMFLEEALAEYRDAILATEAARPAAEAPELLHAETERG